MSLTRDVGGLTIDMDNDVVLRKACKTNSAEKR
jgi:hypothetical protein